MSTTIERPTAPADPWQKQREHVRNGGPCPYCSGLGDLEATDMFSGAGGSSLGLENVRCPVCARSLIRVTQALNHWDLAVEAHNANFPEADHDLHDVEVIPASRFRRTPILWASPECTHHAYCRGPREYDPHAQRSRATFSDIVRFTEHHRYDAVIVENVIEARLWCEAGDRRHGWDPKRKQYRCSCGADFDEWYQHMLDLGYEGRIVYFNSQFALPTPQSRDRMYVVFWRKGLPRPDLGFRPSSWCSSCEQVVRGVQTWKKPSRGSVRDQPGKFEWGRYGSQYVYACPTCKVPVAPAVVGARTIIDWSLDAQRIGDRVKPLAAKTRERIRTGLQRLQTLEPVAVQVGGHMFERRPGVRVWSMNDPFRTVTCDAIHALVAPVGGQTGQGRNPRGVDEPLGSVTTENHRALVVRYGGQGGVGRDSAEPTNTITAHDREIGVVIPNRENATGASVAEPAGTVTTAPAQHMLVQVNRSTKGKAVDRNADPVDVPTRTVAGHGELALVSMRNHGEAVSAHEPAATVCGGGNHHGVLVYNGNPGFVQPLEMAAGTITDRDKQSLLVTDELVITEDDVDDCLFRMLQWHELLRAQQMHEHGDGRAYNLTARRRDRRGQMRELSNEDRVKMIGNAVSSPVATMLGAAVVASLR